MIRALLLLFTMVAAGVSPAFADVTCLINGNITLDSSDSYYCDTSTGIDCTGWTEVDLDSVSRPMQYMGVEIWNLAGSYRYKRVFTNQTGGYAALVTLPGNQPCAGRQLYLFVDLRRVHESDVNAATPRFRFKVTYNNQGLDTLSRKYYRAITLDGPVSAEHWHFDRVPNGTIETEMSAAVNLYYMTNSALTEAVTWGPVIDQAFSSTDETAGGIYRVLWTQAERSQLLVQCGESGGCASVGGWYVAAINIAGNGMLMRHEIGHSLHQAIHGRVGLSDCAGSENFGGSSSRDHRGCEWGSLITREMFVNVLGYRTIAKEDQTTDIWRCGSTTSARVTAGVAQDLCVQCRAAGNSDDDRIVNCLGSGDLFVGIGDTYANAPQHCTRLERAKGCGTCTDTSPADGICDDYTSASGLGWRNPVNFERYIWDLLDASNESYVTLADTSNLSINDLVTIMSTTMGSGNGPGGQDGTFREPSPVGGGSCVPDATVGPNSRDGGGGTRDGYNARDFEQAVPNSQVSLMGINSVAGAVD